jgi:hypothetical protein
MYSSDFQSFLTACILPFIRRKFPTGHRFFMDNNPKHTSLSTRRFIILNNINHFDTHPQSPDQMPIEMVIFNFLLNFPINNLSRYCFVKVWNDLKREIVGAKNKSEIVRNISKWWNAHKNDLEYCNKKFDNRVIDMCITMTGQATGL